MKSPIPSILLVLTLPSSAAALQGLGGLEWTFSGKETGQYMAQAVATGDFNGDDYADVAVGTSLHDSATTLIVGGVFVFYGSESGYASEPDWMVEGEQSGAGFGAAISGDGDLNGDGFDDLVVGAYNHSVAFLGAEGAAFVFYGSANGLNDGADAVASDRDWFASSLKSVSQFGWEVGIVGDVGGPTGPGGEPIDDLLVGCENYSNPQPGEGAVFLWYGAPDDPVTGASGIAGGADGDLTNIAWGVEGDIDAGKLGRTVAGIGNVDGDAGGFADVAVHAVHHGGPGSGFNGHMWVFLGPLSGGMRPLTDAALSVGGGLDPDRFGEAIAGGVDLDLDGLDDFCVGAPGARPMPGSAASGLVTVYGWQGGGLGRKAWTVSGSGANGEYFGGSVSTGDFNGDQLPDVAIGARLWTSDPILVPSSPGAVFVYYGDPVAQGTTLDLSLEPGWTAEGDQHFKWFGEHVVGVRDATGNGADDILVGSHIYDGGFPSSGQAWLFVGEPAESDGLAGAQPTWSASGTIGGLSGEGERLGTSVAGVGDVDGDGFDDVVVGAPDYEGAGLLNQGAAYLFRGGQDDGTGQITLDDVPAWIAAGGVADGRFGFSVAAAGDTNNDGFPDVIVGAPGTFSVSSYHGPSSYSGGNAFVYFGGVPFDTVTGQGGLTQAPQWSASVAGPTPTFFGWSVAGLGDVGGGPGPDGIADVAVGQRGEYDEYAWTAEAWAVQGRVYVWHGVDVLGPNGGAPGDVTNYDWMVQGEQLGDRFGTAMASSDDLDGDGFRDVLIGAYAFDDPSIVGSNGNYAGRVYVWSGPLEAPYPAIQTADQADRSRTGERTGAEFGYAIAAGNVDGDPVPEVVIGAPGHTGYPWEFVGRAYVFYGDGSVLLPEPPQILEHAKPTQDFGRSVAVLGDFDGNFYGDVAVGAPVSSDPTISEGRVLLFGGEFTGLNASPFMGGEGDAIYAYLGGNQPGAVDDAGDVNGDGKTDLIAGAPGWHAGPVPDWSGAVFVYHGENSVLMSVTPAAVLPGDEVTFQICGALPGSFIGVALADASGNPVGGPVGTSVVAADGCGQLTLTVPGFAPAGTYQLIGGALDGGVLALSEAAPVLVQ